MQITGETIIAAPPETVWRALNDPEVLRQCIPGCESLEKVSDTEFKATVTTKIGPMQTRFNGAVTLSDLDPPNGYTISGSGSGGVAGSAKGGAKVRLTKVPEGTKLNWDVDAQVSGKLAQLGSRLIEGVAKMLSSQFFEKFATVVAPAATAADGTAAAKTAAAGGTNWLLWAAVGLGVLLALYFLR
jgi:carbon monoxide dehydrogenase subunit G